MTFDESKISAEKAAETGVQSQPDALTGSAEENKKVFDLLPLLIIEMLNKLIEALQAANSAGQIGADAFTNVTGGTVQEQLQSIQKNLEDYRDAVKVNGAENVGMTPFDGVTANTVQAAPPSNVSLRQMPLRYITPCSRLLRASPEMPP